VRRVLFEEKRQRVRDDVQHGTKTLDGTLR
jgi:hypothetical protein